MIADWKGVYRSKSGLGGGLGLFSPAIEFR